MHRLGYFSNKYGAHSSADVWRMPHGDKGKLLYRHFSRGRGVGGGGRVAVVFFQSAHGGPAREGSLRGAVFFSSTEGQGRVVCWPMTVK